MMMAPPQARGGPDVSPLEALWPWGDGAGGAGRCEFDLPAAQRLCADLARSHYENFPVALALFDRRQAAALAAVYAFARIADDFADEPSFEGRRLDLLDAWEEQLRRCTQDGQRHPVMVALAQAIEDHALPLQPFLDLLDAFRQDCRNPRYENWEQLLDYCRRSADPIGRLVLRILGHADWRLDRLSDSICTALQLTNFWQDLSVDLPRGRLYLPLADLKRFGLSAEEMLAGGTPQRFEDLLDLLVDRTRELFDRGQPLIFSSGFPAVVYLGLVWLGGRSVLRLVRKSGRRVLFRRPALGPLNLGRALGGASLDRLRRVAS